MHVPDLMPHGYTNRTTVDGGVVTKAYQGPDAARRCATEAAALRQLAGRVPVPRLLSADDTTLRMSLMPGAHGQDLIDRGLAAPVLRACGRMLRRIHDTEPALARAGAGDWPPVVLCHGDYGPNNVLLDPDAGDVTAVLDWEWTRTGDRVDDLAWSEWIVRMHHRAHAGALGALFDGYGLMPSWRARQEAMVAQCRSMLSLCERWEPGGAGVHQWRHRLALTQSWTE